MWIDGDLKEMTREYGSERQSQISSCQIGVWSSLAALFVVYGKRVLLL